MKSTYTCIILVLMSLFVFGAGTTCAQEPSGLKNMKGLNFNIRLPGLAIPGLQNKGKFRMPIFKPDPTIDYKISVLKPDPTIDYKILNIFPMHDTPVPLPEYKQRMKPPDFSKPPRFKILR